MKLMDLVNQYGYAAIVIGTFAEGETVLVLGGFAAHQGYLELPWVVVAAFAGSLCGDQCAFFLGRRYGGRLLARFGRLQAGVDRATALLRRHETWLLIGFRFVYGIRNVTPFTAGLSAIPVPRFLLLNVLGALLWST
ncbi:MAG TPA: DedA family protein, partial [Polyangiaceae bacterium]|nr:DedA family protein [Polyangiaceae bacterium]